MNTSNTYNKYLIFLMLIAFISSCSDSSSVKYPAPHDITFNDLALDEFTFQIPDTPLEAGNDKAGFITANVNKQSDGTFSGFALSNKNWRSYPWSLSTDFGPAGGLSPAEEQAAIDSTIFSVYTLYPNKTENYLVGHAVNDDAFITLKKPSVVQHILVGNTTYNFLLERYGSAYSNTYDDDTQTYDIAGDKVHNIQIPDPSASKFSTFRLPGPDGQNLVRLAGQQILEKRAAGEEAAQQARDGGKSEEEAQADSTAAYEAYSSGYVKLTVEGFNGGASTGTVDFYLAVLEGVDQEKPELSYYVSEWYRVDLASLGTVDKLLFTMSSSYVDENGDMLYPRYFCLDGIRLKK